MRWSEAMRALCLLAAAAFGLAACGGKTSGTPGDAGAGDDGAGGGDDGGAPLPVPRTGKLDLLFVIQNTGQMVGVGDYLQAAVPAMFDRFIHPNCVDAGGSVVGPSSSGTCASGQLEFQPVADIHVGIMTSSLGGRGSDQCSPDATNPSNGSLLAHNDDHGELINRAGSSEAPLADAQPSNFLAWFPGSGQPTPPVPAIQTESQLVGDFQSLLADAGLHGCGFPASLEAWYRFLIQPDPYASVEKNGTVASLSGLDTTILQQRHDFLRPDSAVAIVVVANKTEKAADPQSIGGQGWAFTNGSFPGSPNGAAPEGTIECKANPLDPNCTSCAFVQNDPNFATRCPNDGANGTDGYLDPSDDALNLRFFHDKERFGIDPQFPIARYVSALTNPRVPDSAHERDGFGNYAPAPDCTNPLFAAELPSGGAGELCALAPGPRQPGQVFFAILGGVPHQLLQADPSNPDSPQKPSLSAADWDTILGADPLSYDFTGADFHMLESSTPRSGSVCPPTASDDCDPINGREWETNNGELQFACVFPLMAPRDCTLPENSNACACAADALNSNSPLCAPQTGHPGASSTIQIRGAAYPGIRQLSLARSLGGQAVVSSLCPIHSTEAAPGDPLYAYRPAFTALIDRLATVLAR